MNRGSEVIKKILFALVATVGLAVLGLANAEAILSEPAILDGGNLVMAVEAAQQCWPEEMKTLFTEFEPKFKGKSLWVVKEALGPSKCGLP